MPQKSLYDNLFILVLKNNCDVSSRNAYNMSCKQVKENINNVV